MAQITADLVRQLRERTGAGMMDCKKALNDTDGDIDAAVDWLRKKGLSQAAKKAGRTAAEGLVGVHAEGTKGAVVEVNCETDFVARNENFQKFVAELSKLAFDEEAETDALMQATFPSTGRKVEDELTQQIASIGENMKISRAKVMTVSQGAVAGYVHNQLAPNQGKIGVLIALEAGAGPDKLEATAKQIAMHVAAVNPNAITQDDVDPALVEREKKVLEEQARESGKPENIIEKMVQGRMRKFYEENALLDQTFVVDGESRVGDVLDKLGKDLGTEIKVTGMARYQLGETQAEDDQQSAA
ncbi:translation elongation factor Ts [Rhodovibrio salinarum]|uniref:Elongation factor Ts n=1 Tax=Rhodovibrio salinarum TaxID=1087 RepID=A0A934QIS7_9PROT|nr:translation elongation factor Ts [Rhodovibrio salinarum]MBK1697808.1 elongation factor Ts [Rhodovibrio salinarum]